jgi:hypothetical protein
MAKSKTKKTSLKDNLMFKAAKLGSSGYGGYEIMNMLQHMGLFKDGGRVRGCGVAKRGFGKAMKRKK